ncbi:odorant receptor 131-2-like [Xenentodon cancila]
MGSCLIVVILATLYNFVTPVTLTAMSLERYVAICMPLRHAELCTAYRAMQSIAIIHGLSFIPCLVLLFVLAPSVTHSFFEQYKICSVEVFILYRWQGHVRSVVSQFYFLIMCTVIVFSYVQIMKVAKTASGESMESSQKGLRTVALHAFQLLLCLVFLWCPFIETAILQFDYNLYIAIRYFNYVMFSLVPRCLSPLIYGLRDKAFLLALKQYAFCKPFNK